MTAATEIAFENTFVRDLDGLYLPWNAAPAPEPRLVLLNEALAGELGLDPAALRGPAGLGLLTGTAVPGSATTVAQAYAGHQFGNYSPRLGDGRAGCGKRDDNEFFHGVASSLLCPCRR